MTPIEEWNRCREWIEAAIARTPFYNIEDIQRSVEAGEMTFWPGRHAAAVTEFITYPNGKALNVFAGGGDENESLREFLEVFEPSFRAWAKASDCRWVIGYGRPGWDRVMKRLGYATMWTVMMKEIA